MKLTNKSEKISYPEQHYIFIEKIGPFENTAMAAWQELHQVVSSSQVDAQKTGAMALFKIEPQMIYRAGFVYNKKPEIIPAGTQYFKFSGGSYAKYTLTGSYMHLPVAWGKVIDYATQENLQTRQDFYIENYANDPTTTPEDQLISELMIPVK